MGGIIIASRRCCPAPPGHCLGRLGLDGGSDGRRGRAPALILLLLVGGALGLGHALLLAGLRDGGQLAALA